MPAVWIAETVGVPPATVYNWETGRARLPLEHLPKVADALSLHVDALRELLARPAVPTPVRPPRPLRLMRHRTGLPQAVVAARTGASRHLVGAWKRGEQTPPLVAVRRLAAVYGVPVSVVSHAAGVRQSHLADRCGCSVAAVRAWEGGRGVPLPARRRRLEQVFGLAPDALLKALPH